MIYLAKAKAKITDSPYLKIVKAEDWFVFGDYIVTNFSKDYKIVRCDSAESKKREFFTKSFLLDNRKTCYIIDNQKELDGLIDDLDKLLDGSFQNKNVLVYKIPNIDKRSKLYKRYKDLIIEPTISISDLAKDKLNLNLGSQYLSEIYKYCNEIISRCYSELSKVKILSESLNISHNAAAELVIEDLHKRESIGGYTVDIFKLIDAIVAKDFNLIKGYLHNINTDSFDFGLLTLLYNNYHNLYVIKEAGNFATPENTGLSSFIINTAKNNVKKYSLEQLNNILVSLYDLDKQVKSGEIDSTYAYDLMLVRLLS